jgi:hypothetical protein
MLAEVKITTVKDLVDYSTVPVLPIPNSYGHVEAVTTRVSYENSFYSKQPKMEPKLVSTLYETRRLFRLFRFNIETECFGVSIEPKQ